MMPSNSSDFSEQQTWSAVAACNRTFYLAEPKRPYIIVFTINPVDQVPIWLASIANWFAQYAIELVYRHPSQKLSLDFFQQSLGTLLWNGTLPIFNALKQYLSANNLPFSFLECGFFPQTQHLYFDRMGINVHSSLAHADLSGLPADVTAILQQKRQQFFQEVAPHVEHPPYIFIPLQLGDDSNIQLHSRFVNGMQEFINYIEACYPDDCLVFKKHPRDNHDYQLFGKHSSWSNACARALIKGAKRVHGINSSVLFEAELFGIETIIEGDCLLKRHANHKAEMLAAIILWQFDVSLMDYSLEKIAARSYLALDEYLDEHRQKPVI